MLLPFLILIVTFRFLIPDQFASVSLVVMLLVMLSVSIELLVILSASFWATDLTFLNRAFFMLPTGVSLALYRTSISYSIMLSLACLLSSQRLVHYQIQS